MQRVQGWERALNSLSVDYDADVYVAGSNEHMLFSELSTYLSGRYVEIKMLPLSFREYIELHPADSENSIEKRFQDYLEKGAIPLINPDDEMYDELIQGMYSTTLRKYVLSRLEIVNVPALDEIVMFLMSNVGNVTSSSA